MSKPATTEFKVGDYYINEKPYLFVDDVDFSSRLPRIFGHIESDEDCEPGYFWVRGYSEACTDGEIGYEPFTDAMKKISKQEFELARKNGWRNFT